MTEVEMREIFISQIQEKILGPGYAKDIIDCADNYSDEILDIDPTRCYSTGVMVPKSSFDVNEYTDVEDDGKGDQSDSAGQQVNDNLDTTSTAGGVIERENDIDYLDMSSLGLIACVDSQVKNVKLEISYAKYVHLTSTDQLESVKVILNSHVKELESLFCLYDDNQDFNSYLQELGAPYPFRRCFKISDGKLSLAHVFNQPLELNRLINVDYEHSDLIQVNKLLRILLRQNFYKREEMNFQENIEIDDFLEEDSQNTPIVVDEDNNLNCYICSYLFDNKKYVKILLRNEKAGRKNCSSCIYQPKIKVVLPNSCFRTYTDPVNFVDDDFEKKLTDYIYEGVRNLGKGINCALQWNEIGDEIETTFLPQNEIPVFSNNRSIDDGQVNICELRNISIWSKLSDDEIIESLRNFVNEYRSWHEEQQNLGKPGDVKTEIIDKQNQLLERLNNNIDYLVESPEALQTFKIANTAMLIQMVIARDNNFRKNRNLDEVIQKKDILNDISYFQQTRYLNHDGGLRMEPAYRPFQLAFLLMNVKSTFEVDDPYRTDSVDLIWFPTGGGKTEAYLALSALTIVHRRRSGRGAGVSVIMRYTLRLLTTQQFERASFLVCALEFLRKKCVDLNLGDDRITIGLWIGQSSSPNSIREISNRNSKYQLFTAGNRKSNPFPVAYCPWCGSKLIFRTRNIVHGYYRDGSLGCINENCIFYNKLPINYIDEVLYDKETPTLLFATVDKFANLYKDKALRMLGLGDGCNPPDLIIQDELHLISGPLGSCVGMFEFAVHELCKRDGYQPKIIASTATTRNTSELIRKLYGGKNVVVFPAYGISYKDNFFSHLEEKSFRRHLGIMPSMNTDSNITEIRLSAIMILSRIKLFEKYLNEHQVDLSDPGAVYSCISVNDLLRDNLDNFWTIVLYYNSLKDLGRANSRISQEVYENVRSKMIYYDVPHVLNFVYQKFDERTVEFTSRQDSSRIKELLVSAESPTKLNFIDNRYIAVDYNVNNMDLVFASNMISVGIDIARWNLMLMMGQPRSTSEYIQSSSRVARSHQGLVINLLNPLRFREHSIFENYTSFHEAYYRFVEPLSITPVTVQTLGIPLLNNIIEMYQKIHSEIDDDDLKDALLNDMTDYFSLEDDMISYLEDEINARLFNSDDKQSSMRVIDSSSFTKIDDLKYD